MKKILILSLALALSGAALATPAGTHAKEKPSGMNAGTGQSRFDYFDHDHDGKLSKADFERAHPKVAPQFDAIDANGDGFVTKDEIQAYRASLRAKGGDRLAHFEKADLNQDGKLSKEEFAAAYPRVAADFDLVDTDKDGFVSREEMRAYRAKRMEARFNERFDAADTDKDGKLSRSEFSAAYPRLADKFNDMDRDKDGLVSKEEAEAFRRERIKKRK